MRIEVVADIKTVLGESPLWDVEEQRLYWVDIVDRRIFRCTDDGREIRAWDVPEMVGAVALRSQGGAVVALTNGFHFLDFDTGECEPIHDPEPNQPGTRMNDGKVDRQGRFFAGSMDMDGSGGLGALYRLDPDLTCHTIATDIAVSNGPCWSPDNRTFYFTDSRAKTIWAYDYDLATGTPSNRRTFLELDRDAVPSPDGSTVDAEGYLWNARVYQGQLIRYAPDGTVDRTVDMPVKKVTSIMFGGPNLDIIYVTSMAKPPKPHHPPDGVLRGSVFAVHGLGVQGLPEPRFAG